MSGKKLNSDFSDAEPPASEGASVAARAGAPKRTTANRAARESRRTEELRRRGNEQASKAGVNVSKGASKREPLPFNCRAHAASSAKLQKESDPLDGQRRRSF